MAQSNVHLAAMPDKTVRLTVSVGTYRQLRLTAPDGQRRTTAGNHRVVEPWNPLATKNWIQVIGPAFTLFFQHGGNWLLISPLVRHNGVWQTPRQIHVKHDGQWRAVQTPTPAE